MEDKDAITTQSCKVRVHKAFTFIYRKIFVRVDSAASLEKADDDNDFLKKSKSTFLQALLSSSKAFLEKKFPITKKDVSVNTSAALLPPRKRTNFLDLPLQVRQEIYRWMDFQDVLALRLTSLQIKLDVESCHGLCYRLHDGRFEYEKILQTVGIKKLVVENFTHDNPQMTSFLPHNHLLTTIEMVGPVSAKNFEFLLDKAYNLTKLVLAYQTSDVTPQRLGSIKGIALDNLKSLEISSNIFGTLAESPSVPLSIRDILNDLHCSNLSSFKFHVSGFFSERIRSYHRWSRQFLFKNSGNLKNVQIEIKQIMLPFAEHEEPEEDIRLTNEWTGTGLPIRFEELNLSLNSNMHMWYCLIDAQTRLRTLHLNIRNQSWTRLVLVLGKCSKVLEELTVTDLCSLTRDQTTAVPVDLGLLRIVRKLRSLEIQHQGLEWRGINPPIVLRSSFLPPSLISVKLCGLRLRPHQAMCLLLKLPRIKNVDLESWTDSEATLGGFIAVLTFLVKFDQTPATTITITEARRMMENQGNAILKLKSVLRNKAVVEQNNSELYSKLKITSSLF